MTVAPIEALHRPKPALPAAPPREHTHLPNSGRDLSACLYAALHTDSYSQRATDVWQELQRSITIPFRAGLLNLSRAAADELTEFDQRITELKRDAPVLNDFRKLADNARGWAQYPVHHDGGKTLSRLITGCNDVLDGVGTLVHAPWTSHVPSAAVLFWPRLLYALPHL